MAVSRVSGVLSSLVSRPLWLSRTITTTYKLFSDEKSLEEAKQRVMQLKEDPGNEKKLYLYAFYKQATSGVCNTKRPGMMDFVGRAKWDAWNKLGDMSKTEAITNYCQLVDTLVGGAEVTEQTTPTSNQTSGDILVSDDKGVRTVTLNRPAKYNAITVQMYEGLTNILKSSATDNNVRVVLLTGTGDYYCSGNDLSNFLNIPPEGPEKLAADSAQLLKDFVSSFIQFPKPLVSAVNGPAVGISVTILCLFDLVYATDNATFHTPFMQLGQSPEGCSSFLFPRMMGPVRANEMLILGKKISAMEAYERGLITRVYPQTEFQDRIREIVEEIANLPPNSVLQSKALIRSSFNHMLEEANEKECKLLNERWLSEECMQAIINFMQRRK